MSRLRENPLVFRTVRSDEGLERLVSLLSKAGSLQELKMDLVKRASLVSEIDSDPNWDLFLSLLDAEEPGPLIHLNRARKILGLKLYETPKAGDEEAQTAPEETSTPRRGKVGGAK